MHSYFMTSFSASKHSGIGPGQVNNFLTTINLPYVSSTLLQKGYDEVSPAIQHVAEKSVERALQEEAELSMKALSIEGKIKYD